MSEILNKIMLDDIALPGMPDVALKVIAALEDEYCSIRKLEDIIYQDPSLTATILKIGNAPFYKTGKSASTLGETIMTVGLGNLVAVVCVATLTNHVLGRELDMVLFRHMIAVSGASGQLSERAGAVRIQREHAVVAGLLHDIGKLILFDAYPAQYKKVRNAVIGESRPAFEVEKDILGVDHATVGAALAEKWNFPALYQDAIRMHHDAGACPPTAARNQALSYLIRAADKMALDLGIGYGVSTEKHLDELLKALGIDKEDYSAVSKEIRGMKTLEF